MEKRLKNLEDGYKWAKETAQALKSGNLEAVDMDSLVDEIESVYTDSTGSFQTIWRMF